MSGEWIKVLKSFNKARLSEPPPLSLVLVTVNTNSTPLPDSDTNTRGSSGSLLAIVNAAALIPIDVGLNVTLTSRNCFGRIVWGIGVIL